MNEQDTIVVFTARSPERIVREGGSQAWVLNAARAKQCAWLVCTQNRHNPDHEFSDATQAHGSAFLLGKVSGIRRAAPEESDDGKERWLICISEFARLDVPNAWDHGRNPVRYSSLERLGIDPNAHDFQPVPEHSVASPAASPTTSPSISPRGLTIAEARNGLAATFGVKPEAVEITIRG
jgi:hypothetical protein